MSDTERLNWLLAQLGFSRDDLDWAIDQDGFLDVADLWPPRSNPWSPERAAVMERMKQVRAAYPEMGEPDFLADRVFPVIPLKTQPGEVHFRKVTA
jgi:hypothetical protein